MDERNAQTVMFERLFDKPVHVSFTAPDQSSDGGVLLLKGVDEKLGLTERMAAAMRDTRQDAKVRHPVGEMLRERVLAIACGYPDANDAARLSRDPAMLLACERREQALASQATLSRLENRVTSTELLRMGLALADTVIEQERSRRKASRVRRITIDMDSTEDATYGAQQLTFFNAFYDNWRRLPMLATIQFGGEPDHHLVAAVLRPGNAGGSLGAVTILKRLLPKLRAAFPKARLFIRMDGGFATPDLFAWLEGQGLLYAVNMPKNSVLKRLAEPFMPALRSRAQQSGRTETAFGEARYQAGEWKAARRAILKAEVAVLDGRAPRDNPRFVITNLPWTPRNVYRFYALRGDAENRIKELKLGLRFDLTPCPRFQANQFRNLLTAAAYVLCQRLRLAARGTSCERAQVWTLRERLLKLAVTIRESARRIWIEAPKTHAWMAVWRTVALRVGATP